MKPNDQRLSSSSSASALEPRTLLRILLTVAFSVLGVLLFAQFAGAVATPLVFVLLAGVLALGLNPLVARFEARLHIPRPLGAGLVIAGLALFALVFMALVVPLVVTDATGQRNQGISFVAALYREDLLLRLAHAWQTASDIHVKRPPKFS